MPTDAEQRASSEVPAPAHGISALRRALALVVALGSDVASLSLELVPPAEWTLDAATAIALFAVLSFRWWLLPALVVEAIPGLSAFPIWTLAVLALIGAAFTRQRRSG